MTLYNASSRARNAGQLMNRNSGGGDKKAGFPYMVGRSYTTSIYFNANGVIKGNCCKIGFMNKLMPNVSISRPIGRNANPAYWGMY